MSGETNDIWIEIIIEKVNYLISFVYHPHQHIVIIMKNISNMLDKVDAVEKDNLGDLSFDYKPGESLNSNPLYHIENAYGYTRMITETIRTTITMESIIDVLLASNPEIHTKYGTIKYVQATTIWFKLWLLYLVKGLSS